jgi:hypothetical protein
VALVLSLSTGDAPARLGPDASASGETAIEVVPPLKGPAAPDVDLDAIERAVFTDPAKAEALLSELQWLAAGSGQDRRRLHGAARSEAERRSLGLETASFEEVRRTTILVKISARLADPQTPPSSALQDALRKRIDFMALAFKGVGSMGRIEMEVGATLALLAPTEPAVRRDVGKLIEALSAPPYGEDPGRWRESQARLAQSLEHFERATEGEERKRWLRLRCEQLVAARALESAAELVTSALAQGNDPELLVVRAEVSWLFVRDGRQWTASIPTPASAVADLGEVLAKAPDHLAARYLRGRLRGRAGDPAGGLSDLLAFVRRANPGRGRFEETRFPPSVGLLWGGLAPGKRDALAAPISRLIRNDPHGRFGGWRLRLAHLHSNAGELQAAARELAWLADPRNSTGVPASLRRHRDVFAALAVSLNDGRDPVARERLGALFADVDAEWTAQDRNAYLLR